MLPVFRSYLDGALPLRRVADQGCGKLRNLAALTGFARKLYLVDTQAQINSTTVRWGRHVPLTALARDFGANHDTTIRLLDDASFARSRLELDAVLSVAVYDVVPRAVRAQIIRDAHRNLRRDGYLLLVVPRNDASITQRCRPTNRYADGHVFANRRALTFYRNFARRDALLRVLTKAGFALEADLSTYRYLTLVLRAR